MLCVAEEIYTKLDGPWPDQEDATRWRQAGVHLDVFVRGDMIPVPREDATKFKNGYIGRLRPADREVWEVRCLEPAPGIRLFGRFAERDLFVAVTYERREDLGYEPEPWKAAIDRARTYWNNLLPGYQPLEKGKYPDDYLSDFYIL